MTTMLIRAVKKGGYDQVSEVLKAGVDVDELDADGLTASWYATDKLDGEVLDLLKRSEAAIVPAMRAAVWTKRVGLLMMIGTFVLVGVQLACRPPSGGYARSIALFEVFVLAAWMLSIHVVYALARLYLRGVCRRQLRGLKPRSCPYCLEQVSRTAIRCAYCHENLPD